MLDVSSDLPQSLTFRIGALVLATAAAVILTALAFEHIGGYLPCPLCLQQRYAYYAAIPVLGLALVLLRGGREPVAAALFALVALAFLVNAGLGTYQAGAEWQFWDPPSTCAASDPPEVNLGSGELGPPPVTCGEASGRFLGLSFAGWNVVASLLLAAGATAAALFAARTANWPRGRAPG
jgi:disulfide bond formation protein DsbB